MIDPKDRNQILRMAGNIASGFASFPGAKMEAIVLNSVTIAIHILKETDHRIREENHE